MQQKGEEMWQIEHNELERKSAMEIHKVAKSIVSKLSSSSFSEMSEAALLCLRYVKSGQNEKIKQLLRILSEIQPVRNGHLSPLEVWTVHAESIETVWHSACLAATVDGSECAPTAILVCRRARRELQAAEWRQLAV